MKNAYKEVRRMSASRLRALCIEKDWYTRGDNDEYGHLLIDLAANKATLTTDDIIAIAEDIAAHSKLAEGETVESIAYEVNKACSTCFVPDVPEHFDN